MSAKEINPNEQIKNMSEKDTNINSDMMKKYIPESPNNDNNNDEEEKPIHFKVEYDKNKYIENQIESSPENNKNNSPSKSPSEQKEQEFIIEKNNQADENQQEINNNINNPEMYQENNDIKNAQNVQQQIYNLLKENNLQDNKPENINNYYYYYLNNYNNNKSLKTSSEEETGSKRVINFATKTYQGRIDPVHLNKTYNNFWQKQNKNKNKYKEKMEALQKVFHPNGYNPVTGKFKRKGKSQSRNSSSISVNNLERAPFDNTKAPLPKQSYLVVPYDYGLNDPNWGKEDPADYDRKKMVKLRMLKQPLKYYYPYTVENFRKKNFKYE